MKITIEPTEQFFMIDEVMVRAWKGTDDQGNPVIALVTGIQVPEDAKAYDNLVSIPAPTGEDARRWAAEVLSRRYDDDPPSREYAIDPSNPPPLTEGQKEELARLRAIQERDDEHDAKR